MESLKHGSVAIIIENQAKLAINKVIQKAEDEFVANTVSKWSRSEIRRRLKEDLQTACQIELATIPIYLFTYYSISRTKTIDSSDEQIRDINYSPTKRVAIL